MKDRARDYLGLMADAAARATRAVGDAAIATGAAASSATSTAGAMVRDPAKFAREVESSAKRAILLTAIPDDGSLVTRHVRGFTHQNPNDAWNYVSRGVTAAIKRRVTGGQQGLIDRMLADQVDMAVADAASRVGRSASERVEAVKRTVGRALARVSPLQLLPGKGDVALALMNFAVQRTLDARGGHIPDRSAARRELYRHLKREAPHLQYRYSRDFREWSAGDDAVRSGIENVKRKLSSPRPAVPMKAPPRLLKGIRDQRAALDRANAYRFTGYAEGKRAAALAFRGATAERREYLLGWWRVSPSGNRHWVRGPRRS